MKKVLIKMQALAQAFFCELCGIFKNVYGTSPVAASVCKQNLKYIHLMHIINLT